MKIRLVIVGLLLGFVMAGGALAKEHNHGSAPQTIPESVPGIWTQIKEHEEILNEAIKKGKLDKLHETAFEIWDLASALAQRITSLTPEKLENVKAGSETLKKIAILLDKYGDAGDRVNAVKQFEKLTKTLNYMESQYPSSLLRVDTKPKASGKNVNTRI